MVRIIGVRVRFGGNGKIRIRITGVKIQFGHKVRIRIIGFRFRFLVRVGSGL